MENGATADGAAKTMNAETQLIAAISALAAVVGWFGTRMWKDLEDVKREAKELRTEYGNLRQKYGEVKGIVSGVSGCTVQGCQWRNVLGTPPLGERIGSDPANPSIFKTPRIPIK